MGFETLVNLKSMVLVHFILSSLAMTVAWLPASYLWSQSIILILGIWCIQNKDSNSELLTLLSIAHISSVVLDALAVGLNWRTGFYPSGEVAFTGAMAIILIIIKPVLAFFTFKLSRSTTPDIQSRPQFGNWSPSDSSASNAAPQAPYGGYQTEYNPTKA